MNLFARLVVDGVPLRKHFGISSIFLAYKRNVADIRVSQQTSGMPPWPQVIAFSTTNQQPARPTTCSRPHFTWPSKFQVENLMKNSIPLHSLHTHATRFGMQIRAAQQQKRWKMREGLLERDRRWGWRGVNYAQRNGYTKKWEPSEMEKMESNNTHQKAGWVMSSNAESNSSIGRNQAEVEAEYAVSTTCGRQTSVARVGPKHE